MFPVYEIAVDGKVVSSTGDARLVELSLSDEVGFRSDSFSFVLDDSDGALELPRRGVRLDVRMGAGVLVDMGSFFVNSVMASGAPDLLRVDALAAAYVSGKAMQGRRSASYEGVSLAALAELVAGRYGLEVMAEVDVRGVVFDHIDQCNESDMGFLNRAALSAGFIVKPCAGRVLIGRRFSGKSVSGRVLEPRVLERHEVSNWQASVSDLEAYGAVVAEYRDVKSGGVKEFVMGAGEPELRLPHIYANKASAKRGAETKLRNVQEGSGMLVEAAMPGDAELFSGMPVVLAGFRRGVDGAYWINRVVHAMSRSGFTSSISLLRKYEEEG